MKKTIVVFTVFIALAVATGLWFSPLSGLGEARSYYDNSEVEELVGACYNADTVRVDLDGDESDMMAALDRIFARPIKTVRTDDSVIVYAFSPRVAAKSQMTSEGEKYNVMAACSERGIVIGTPVISGSY